MTTHPNEVTSMRVNLGPCCPYLMAQLQVAAAAFSPTKFAMSMANKEHRKEIDKLSHGFNKTRSLFVGGKLKSINSGELDAIVLPVMTAAFIECNKAMAKVELENTLQEKSDRNNTARPPGSIHVYFRSTSIHDNNLILSVIDGQWAKGPMKDISTKF